MRRKKHIDEKDIDVSEAKIVLRRPRTIRGVLLIPFMWAVISLIMDMTMFAMNNQPFPPYFLVGVAFVIAFAAAVSCIPFRSIQVAILGICMILQTVTTIANLVAFHNLGEIFILETLKSFREIATGVEAQKWNPAFFISIIAVLDAIFIVVCIYTMIKCRRQRAGYPFRALSCVAAAMFLGFTCVIANAAIIDRRTYNTYFERLTDPIFSMASFNDRPKALYSFGSHVFYFNNLLRMAGRKSMANSPVSAGIEMDWDDTEYYGDYPYMLDANMNVLMLMMETQEEAAINDLLMPNLSGIRKQSTSVDGYYSIERTCFSEYASLVGPQVMGVEMWREYTKTNVTMSLPNTFRRSWAAAGLTPEQYQLGAFTRYYKEFYNRDKFYTPTASGMDFIHDTEHYNVTTNKQIPWNGDVELFNDEALAEMVPTDKRFFSWVLNVSTHAPHFNNQHTNYSPALAAAGEFPYVSMFEDSLNYIRDNFDELKAMYPKLASTNITTQHAAVTYLVGLHEYDMGLGKLFGYMAEKDLFKNTAIIMYSDHYNYMAYNNPKNVGGGGLLTNNAPENPTGEKCAFMIYNPHDTYALEHGRVIKSFMSNNDIFKTVAHLFNIQTHGNFTIGNSVLSRYDFVANETRPWTEWPTGVSVGIGYYNGLFFGQDLDDPAILYSTRDMKRFVNRPSDDTILASKAQMERYARTILKIRSYYDGNKFDKDENSLYIIG